MVRGEIVDMQRRVTARTEGTEQSARLASTSAKGGEFSRGAPGSLRPNTRRDKKVVVCCCGPVAGPVA